MTASTSHKPLTPSLSEIANAIAPKGGLKDFFGLLSGLRAYRVYTALESRSDPELRAMGLTRADLPRVAMQTMLGTQETK